MQEPGPVATVCSIVRLDETGEVTRTGQSGKGRLTGTVAVKGCARLWQPRNAQGVSANKFPELSPLWLSNAVGAPHGVTAESKGTQGLQGTEQGGEVGEQTWK